MNGNGFLAQMFYMVGYVIYNVAGCAWARINFGGILVLEPFMNAHQLHNARQSGYPGWLTFPLGFISPIFIAGYLILMFAAHVYSRAIEHHQDRATSAAKKLARD